MLRHRFEMPLRLATVGLAIVAILTSAACRPDRYSANSSVTPPTTIVSATSEAAAPIVPPLEASLNLLELDADAVAPCTLTGTGRYPVQDDPGKGGYLAKMSALGIVGGVLQTFEDETSRGMLSVWLLQRSPDPADLARAASATLERSIDLDQAFDNVKIADHPLGEHAGCLEFQSTLQGVEYLTYACYLVSGNVASDLVLMVDGEAQDGLANASRVMAAVAERVNAAAASAGQ